MLAHHSSKAPVELGQSFQLSESQDSESSDAWSLTASLLPTMAKASRNDGRLFLFEFPCVCLSDIYYIGLIAGSAPENVCPVALASGDNTI